MKTHLTVLTLLLLVLTSWSFPWQVGATLGEGSASLAKDRKALSSTKTTSSSQGTYTVQEITSDATLVREYLTTSGVVFGVAWNGMVHPDLTTLLGSYASEYQEARRKAKHGHGQRHLRVRASRVVVESWGHMRNLRGRAYLPALLPEGVSYNEIN
jgi:hypothetical protein